MYGGEKKNIRVVQLVSSYWLHRVNLWECFPCVEEHHGPMIRCAVSIPKANILDLVPDEYEVFYFTRAISSMMGFVFRKAYGSGRFIDSNVDAAVMKEVVLK